MTYLILMDGIELDRIEFKGLTEAEMEHAMYFRIQEVAKNKGIPSEMLEMKTLEEKKILSD